MWQLSHSGGLEEKTQPGNVALGFSGIGQRSAGMEGLFEPTGFQISGGRRGLADPCLVNDAPRSSPAIAAEELLSDTENMGRGGPKANTVSKKRGPGAS